MRHRENFVKKKINVIQLILKLYDLNDLFSSLFIKETKTFKSPLMWQIKQLHVI